MSTGKHLNRTTIGPNTDRRQAIVALAAAILDDEHRRLADAQSDLQNWQAGRVTGHMTSGSVKAARRAVCKAEARVKAAQTLHEMAVAYAQRRAYLFHDAPQTSPAGQQARATAETATESSGENQTPSDESEDTQNQATVSAGNCACIRYAMTPEMGERTPYDHHPRCLLPLPFVRADERPYWPGWVTGVALVPSAISGMDGSGM